MISTKILLITADDSMATSIITCLSQSGYQVVRSARGMSALELIHAEKPACLILDVELPDYNSMAIIRSLRSTDGDERLPVILMGSNLREEEALLGLEVGADLCLRETFHPQVFVARIRSLLRRSELVKVR
jgi:two-component system OmpR family response regulator